MNTNLLTVLITALVIVNLLPIAFLALNKRSEPPLPSRIVTRVLTVLSVIGGAPGVLIAQLIYPKERTGHRMRLAGVSMAAWAIVGCTAAFVPNKLGPNDAPVNPSGSEEAPVVTTVPWRPTEDEPGPTEETEPRIPRDPTQISLVAIGDMLMHLSVSDRALMPDGSYDYTFIFEQIRDDVQQADFAVVNNEVPFGGNEYGLRSYPLFNVFTELGDAEIEAGFDIMLCATNHVMDMNVAGLERTMEFWKKYPQATILGVHESKEDQDTIRYVEKGGYKIALFNYTYGINSYGVPDDRQYMVDLMKVGFKDKMKAELERAEREADFTIVFPHWGDEYQLKENYDQHYWASFFTECGADLIIGTHPHVLEPVRTVTAANGNTSLCYYSLGNYISGQDETISVLGGMAKVTLQCDEENGVRIADHGMQYLVTHFEKDFHYPYVHKLENYTDEMAATHGIVLDNLPGNGLNIFYPFRVSTFYRVIDEIEGRIPDARIEPTPAPEPEPEPVPGPAPGPEPIPVPEPVPPEEPVVPEEGGGPEDEPPAPGEETPEDTPAEEPTTAPVTTVPPTTQTEPEPEPTTTPPAEEPTTEAPTTTAPPTEAPTEPEPPAEESTEAPPPDIPEEPGGEDVPAP